jgi:hypothetical protein
VAKRRAADIPRAIHALIEGHIKGFNTQDDDLFSAFDTTVEALMTAKRCR